MSHIHWPDGFLPVWLWISGYVVTAALVALLWRGGRATAATRRFALLGVFAALMVLVALLEIPPFGYHFNLSVVTGIVLGPQLAVLAALIVNIILALLGHGGLTVIGLNTLTLATEMLVGYGLFRLLARGRMPVWSAGFIATVLGLACGTALSFGIVAAGASGINDALQSARFQPSGEVRDVVVGAHLSLHRLAIITFGLGAIGWVLEGVLSAAALGYLERVYPGLIRGKE